MGAGVRQHGIGGGTGRGVGTGCPINLSPDQAARQSRTEPGRLPGRRSAQKQEDSRSKKSVVRMAWVLPGESQRPPSPARALSDTGEVHKRAAHRDLAGKALPTARHGSTGHWNVHLHRSGNRWCGPARAALAV